jgi:ATP:ADP antiporter, AAA family
MISQPRPAGNRWLLGGNEIRSGEGRAVLAGGLMFFFLLTSLMVLRPAREALGLERGVEGVRRLFLVTVVCTLPLVPLFGWLVSRCSRRRLVGLSLRLCALILLGFYAGLTLLPEGMRSLVAGCYYVFHSVFNLFVVSVFWAFMADYFNLAESKRLFPAITLGGSLGAILGSLISWQLAEFVGVSVLFLLAAALLELAVWVATLFSRTRSATNFSPVDTRPIGGSWVRGIGAVAQSPYLQGVGLFVVLIGVVSTFLYFTSLNLVAAASDSTVQQTALFAHINLWTQLATLIAQGFLTARIMRWAGVAGALLVLPVLAMGGFAVLAVAPTLAVFTMVNALFRAAQQGIAGPAQQTLFTVLDRQDKYKAKSFLDTFGYRVGDAVGAYLERALSMLGFGVFPLAAAVLGVSAVWLVLCRFLGRTQVQLAMRDRLPDA